jgi:superfamily II DNA or RNA helicase
VTGTGKTHLGLEAVAQTISGGSRATVLVPSQLLQRQWELRLEEFVPDAVIAKIGGTAHGDPATADVVIAVVNSALKKDLTSLGRGMELLVADEAHRYGGESWAYALRAGYERRLGLTATLERSGDDGVDEVLLPYFNSVVHKYGYDRATREAVVAPFDLVLLGVELDPDEAEEYRALDRRLSSASKVLRRVSRPGVPLTSQLGVLRSMGGDITKAVISFEASARARRKLLADTRAKKDALGDLAEFVSESDGTVVFTQSLDTAEAAAEVLREQGLLAEAVHSKMGSRQRQNLISALGDGEVQALSAPKILDEGIDVPDVNLGIVLGASTSRRQMIQRLGRVIRLKPDNGRARFVILYVCDTVEDPEQGAREDFMHEVEDAASTVALFREWDQDTLDDIWAGTCEPWVREQDRSISADEERSPDPVVKLVEPSSVAPVIEAPPMRSTPHPATALLGPAARPTLASPDRGSRVPASVRRGTRRASLMTPDDELRAVLADIDALEHLITTLGSDEVSA